jgi:hypothetical protein
MPQEFLTHRLVGILAGAAGFRVAIELRCSADVHLEERVEWALRLVPRYLRCLPK